MSLLFAQFAERYSAMRGEYDLLLEAAYARAAEACHGRLLNDRGRRAGIDSRSLFLGPAVRVAAYASPELLEHFERYPRTTVAQFERQYFDPDHQE